MFESYRTKWKAGVATMVIHGAVAFAFISGIAFPSSRPGNRQEQRSLQVFMLPAGKAAPDMPSPGPDKPQTVRPGPNPLKIPKPIAFARPAQKDVTVDRENSTAQLDYSARSDFILYRQMLLDHLRPFHSYPAALRGKAVHGVVLVGFLMRRDGSVQEAWVETSSGSGDLDTAALSTIRTAQPLPAIPSALPESLTMTIPLSYATPKLSALP